MVSGALFVTSGLELEMQMLPANKWVMMEKVYLDNDVFGV